ncbi:hypothetical protein LTR84_006596 [Exophiala bonariae]|uniref:Extracellular membrane protein CFEM domain-containing protein n=1 Tax=Exophiala bonariae TaxID=1690606 RepID=A0AAV9N0R8_9EURO|nr:hypothetical protein LTR84_006596 [Exophiala bonariae]
MVLTKKFLILVTFLCSLVNAHTFLLHPRHDDEHEHDHNDTSGTGAGHDMSHGAFNFTPSGIEWPQCLRDCCNSFFEFFPEPVNNPLCVNQDFNTNVTTCVAQNCTTFEQGAYVAVATIECPADRDDPVDVTTNGTILALQAAGGEPQNCTAVDNSSISCENGTQTGSGSSGSAASGLTVSLQSPVGLAALVGLLTCL